MKKTEKLTDEELNTVTGGAQPLYVSQPCEVPGRGMAVYVMPVSGQSSYDPQEVFDELNGWWQNNSL